MKIKKCTSLLLALLLLVSNIGLAVNVHYCGGNLAGISASYSMSEAKKSCCGIEIEKNNCCDNKSIKVDKKSDIDTKTFSFQIDTPIALEDWNPFVFHSIAKITQPQTPNYYCDAHAPPLYQLYSQYIFYA